MLAYLGQELGGDPLIINFYAILQLFNKLIYAKLWTIVAIFNAFICAMYEWLAARLAFFTNKVGLLGGMDLL